MDIRNSLEAQLGKGRIRTEEPLAKYTTLKIGGPAEFFYSAQSSQEVLQAVQVVQELKLPFVILGGGTNVLISDSGLRGIVILNESRTIQISKRFGTVKSRKISLGRVLVSTDSGVLVNQLVRFSLSEGLGGLERHLGLPGTVGGALYMNSKWAKPITYIGDVLYQAQIVGQGGQLKTVGQRYFEFAYDRSILQKTHETVLTATFQLTPEKKEILWAKAQESMDYRKSTQPIGVATAGCTFRNISLGDALRICTPNRTTSAGFLVDQVGLKNFQTGKAKFSDKHANFILNLGTATAQNVKDLIDEAKKRVRERFKVEIEPEIVLLGEFK